jgi:hypothetical protein
MDGSRDSALDEINEPFAITRVADPLCRELLRSSDRQKRGFQLRIFVHCCPCIELLIAHAPCHACSLGEEQQLLHHPAIAMGQLFGLPHDLALCIALPLGDGHRLAPKLSNPDAIIDSHAALRIPDRTLQVLAPQHAFAAIREQACKVGCRLITPELIVRGTMLNEATG